MTVPKQKSNYFTEETEKYIIEYNQSTDPDHKSRIFSTYIYYPFYKIAENIIHTWKMYYLDVDNLEELKHDIVSMLVEEKIHKYDPIQGKAYSYFSTIVKRWLINYNDKNYKKLKKEGALGSIDEAYEPDTDMKIDSTYIVESEEFLDYLVSNIYNNLEDLFPDPLDRKVADALLVVCTNRSKLHLFQKKAINKYVKEIVPECKTTQIKKVRDRLELLTKSTKRSLSDEEFYFS